MLRSAVFPAPKPIREFKKPKSGKGKGKPLTPRQRLEKRADTLVREIVLDRDGYCVCPAPIKGHSNVFQCGHLISRGRESLKWCLFNCSVQCSGCNARHEHYPEIYTAWFIRTFGTEMYLSLEQESYIVRKLSIDELEYLISQLDSIHRRQMDRPDWKPRFSQKEILDGSWRNYERTISVQVSPLLTNNELSAQPFGR